MQNGIARLALSLLLGSVLVQAAAQAPSGPDAAVTALLGQARYWQGRNRPDLAQEALDKLFRISPDMPDGLAAQGLLELQNGQPDKARSTLEHLRHVRPNHPAISQIERLLQISGPDKAQLRQARQMAKNGQVDEALRIFRKIFPSGPPEGSYAVEYWQLMARTARGRGPALRALEKLAHDNPDNLSYRLALARQRTSRPPWSHQDLQTLIDLTRLPEFSQEARNAWRDAVMGLDLLTPSSVPLLSEYLAQNPGDLGVKERLNNTSQALKHQQALLADPYYQAKLQGLALLQQGHFERARKLLLQSLNKFPQDVDAVGGVGLTFMRQSRYREALPWFRQTLQMQPAERSKWNALLQSSRFWGLMQEARALRDAHQYDAAETKIQQALALEPLQVDALAALARVQSDRMKAENHPEEAIRILAAALPLDPDDPWIRYDLAGLYAEAGNRAQGEALFEELLHRHPQDASDLYAYALYQSQQGEPAKALATLEHVPKAQRPGKIAALQRRLWVEVQVQQARQLATEHHLDAARQMLSKIEKAVGHDSSLATDVAFAWAAQDDVARAQSLFDSILATHPDESAAWHLRYANFLADSGPSDKLQKELALLDASKLTGEEARDLAHLHERVTLKTVEQRIDAGDAKTARRLLDPLLAGSPDSSQMLELSSQIDRMNGQLDQAIDTLQRALGENGSTYQYKRLAQMLDQRNDWLSSAYDRLTRGGTPGQSQFDSSEIPVEWKTPWGPGGQLMLRSDQVAVSAGTLNLQDSYATRTFGSMLLCQPNCSAALTQQTALGRSYTAGYSEGDLRMDLGTTPQGFAVTHWVGGVREKGDLGPISWSIDASRRPITSTLLSYAGTRDPRTGAVWGGVVATGTTLGMSLDKGGTLGFWANLGAHQLTGDNVESNNRIQFMSGLNWRVINEDDRLFSTGLGTMVWHFKEDAGEFTFGHGGYYSPQQYASLSLPLTYAQRYTRFSYVVRGSVFTSWSQTNAAPYFPTSSALQAAAGNPTYQASSGPGSGYSAIAAWEYQVTPHLFVGNRLEIERSPYYAPNSMIFYLRYALDRAAAQPVFLQPEPVIPTSQF